MRRTLLVGGTTAELDPPRLVRRDLVIQDDVLGDDTEVPTTSTVDCTGCILAPGFVVGHTHLYSALARGMPGPAVPPQSFRQILERVWWRLDMALDFESLSISAEVGAIEALKAGATTIVDHHESPRCIDGSLDVIEGALEKIGVRGVLAYGATDRHGPDGARAGLRESERFAGKNKTNPRVRGMIGIHAPFTVSDDTLDAATGLAGALQVPIHLHAAEGPDDQRASRDRWNERLIPHLDRIGLLSRGALLAHCVDIDKGGAERLSQRPVWVAHMARSNMNNGVGYAQHLLDKLDRVVLGTDGIDNDILAELKVAFFRNREHTGPQVWRDPVAMLARGHRMASQIFGLHLGKLARGAPADLVVLAYDGPTPLREDTLGSHLLFGLSSLHVRDVFVAGKAVVRNRKLVAVDEREVFARAREIAPKMWSRLGAR